MIDKKAIPRPTYVKAPKTSPLNFRTTEHLRILITNSAKLHDRSITHEVERRIDDSFGLGEAIPREDITQILREISVLLDVVELKFGCRWTDDAATFTAARAGILCLFDRHLVEEQKLVSDQLRAECEAVGVSVADAIAPVANSSLMSRSLHDAIERLATGAKDK